MPPSGANNEPRPEDADRRAELDPAELDPKEVNGTAEPADSSSEDRAQKGKEKKQRPFWVELPILIVVAFILAFLFQHFIGRVYSIPSGSMETTLHGCNGCYGDKIFVDKLVYDFSDVTPGEVVVFKGPDAWLENDAPVERSDNPVVSFFQSIGSLVGLAPPDERDFVKRVIATGGQTVECCDANNRVLVDGKPLDEPYIHWEDGTPPQQAPFDPVRVPDNAVWVMGDNRNSSLDSRYQGGGGERGAVPVGNIIGKARVIVLPPSRWDGVSSHNPQTSAQAAAQPASVAMSAAGWQQGLPLALGAVAAWPTVWGGRRIVTTVRKVTGRKP